MVKLTPEQQCHFMEQAPSAFVPCAGAWGKGGSTNVHLASAPKRLVKAALGDAVNNVAQAKPKRR